MRRPRNGTGLIESWPVRVAELAVNLLLVGVAVLVASLPVVTAIPACAAGFGVMRDWRRLGDTAVLRPLLRHLRAGLPLAVLSVPLAAAAACAVLSVRIMPLLQPVALRVPVVIVAWAALMAVSTVITLTLPVWVHYNVGVAKAVHLAASLAVRHPGLGGAVAVAVAVCALLVVIVPPILLVVAGPTIFTIHSLASPVFEREDAVT